MIQSNQDDLRGAAYCRWHKPETLAPKTQVPLGETRDIYLARGRYLTVVAPPMTNPLFHLPQDHWPHAVDVPAIARIAEGVPNVVVALTR